MATSPFTRLLATSLGALAGLGSSAAVIARPQPPYRVVREDPADRRRRMLRGHLRRVTPHAAPMFLAICRTPDGGRRYHRCMTRDQATAHGPYLIEHVNGFGQVTRRERFA